MLWKNDKELFALAKKELFTALVGDIMDSKKRYHQFLSQSLKPLDPKQVVIGRALPVLEADVFGDRVANTHLSVMEKPFGLMFHALDDLKEDEVYVASGSSFNYAMWGGMMTARAKVLKSAGAVLNGFTRDTPDILAQDFPCFSRGTYAQDQGVRGKVIDYRVPIEIEGVRINPGDIIYGDLDGVIVVPQDIEREVFEEALEKGRAENKLREAVENGMSAVEAYRTFGIF